MTSRARRERADVVALLVARPDRSALFSDFDGTVSNVVLDPEQAVPVDGVAEDLSALARRLGRAGVVSGRPAGWLALRFGVHPDPRDARLLDPPLDLFGLHGLERWSPAGVVPSDAALAYVATVAEARRRAEQSEVPGMVVEDKIYALTLHWRAARDIPGTPERAAAVAAELGRELQLELRPGKASIELFPPVHVDKGTVVRERGAGFEVVVWMGDDVGDLHGFDACDELEANGGEVARVAVASDEAPAELIERADLVLDGPEDAAGFLRAIVEAVTAPG